jgi:hypothetical protein
MAIATNNSINEKPADRHRAVVVRPLIFSALSRRSHAPDANVSDDVGQRHDDADQYDHANRTADPHPDVAGHFRK